MKNITIRMIRMSGYMERMGMSSQLPKYRFCQKNEASAPEQESQQEKVIDPEIFKKHIHKLEEQMTQQSEKMKDQSKLIKQLEDSNKDHNVKIKELREVLKAELEEQELQQKRAQKEKDQLKIFAITNFAKELLDVQDNLERAIESQQNNQEQSALLEGVLLTHNILEKVFKKFDVKKMDCLGQKFDPNFHESLFQVQDPEKEAGSICYVAQDGYAIGERVLRPAKVGVVKQ